jgi:hypothetical protein
MTEVLHVAAVQRLIAAARQEAPLSPVMTQCLDQLDAHATALATARAEIARLSTFLRIGQARQTNLPR